MIFWLFLGVLAPAGIYVWLYEFSLAPLSVLVAFLLFYVMLFYGAYVAFVARRRYTLEIKTLRFAITTVKDYNLNVDATDLAPSADDFIPNTATGQLNELRSAQLIQQVFHIWEEMRRESDLAVRGYVEELSPLRTKVRAIETLAIRLGILGTFIGLLAGLFPIGQAYRVGQFANADIGQLVTGLTAAFSTSVAGLMASFFIQGFANDCDRKFATFSSLARTTWLDLGHLLSRIETRSDLPSHLNSLEITADKLRADLNQTGKAIRRNADEMQETIRQQAGKLAVAAGAMEDSKAFLEQIRQENRERYQLVDASIKALTDFEQTVPRLFEQRLAGLVESVAADSQAERTKIADRMDVLVNQLGEKDALTDQQIELFRQTIDAFSGSVAELRAFEESIPEGIAQRLDYLYGQMSDHIAEEREGIESKLEDFNAVMRTETELAARARDNLTSAVRMFENAADNLTASTGALSKELKTHGKLLLKAERGHQGGNQYILLPMFTFLAVLSAMLLSKAAEPYLPNMASAAANEPVMIEYGPPPSELAPVPPTRPPEADSSAIPDRSPPQVPPTEDSARLQAEQAVAE